MNTAQQLGAALGIALLSTISATTTAGHHAPDGAALRAALTDGYTTAYRWAGGLMVVAALIAAFAVTTRERHPGTAPVA